jgi:hypothetical protein
VISGKVSVFEKVYVEADELMVGFPNVQSFDNSMEKRKTRGFP